MTRLPGTRFRRQENIHNCGKIPCHKELFDIFENLSNVHSAEKSACCRIHPRPPATMKHVQECMDMHAQICSRIATALIILTCTHTCKRKHQSLAITPGTITHTTEDSTHILTYVSACVAISMNVCTRSIIISQPYLHVRCVVHGIYIVYILVCTHICMCIYEYMYEIHIGDRPLAKISCRLNTQCSW